MVGQCRISATDVYHMTVLNAASASLPSARRPPLQQQQQQQQQQPPIMLFDGPQQPAAAQTPVHNIRSSRLVGLKGRICCNTSEPNSLKEPTLRIETNLNGSDQS
jgi:hypothetical protein